MQIVADCDRWRKQLDAAMDVVDVKSVRKLGVESNKACEVLQAVEEQAKGAVKRLKGK